MVRKTTPLRRKRKKKAKAEKAADARIVALTDLRVQVLWSDGTHLTYTWAELRSFAKTGPPYETLYDRASAQAKVAGLKVKLWTTVR